MTHGALGFELIPLAESHTQICKNVQCKYVSFNTSVASLNPGEALRSGSDL